MPFKGRIDFFVPHMVLQRPSGGPRAGGHREGELGGPHHDDQEHYQIHVSHHFQNGITLDRHVIMIVSGPKKAIQKILSMPHEGKCRPGC